MKDPAFEEFDRKKLLEQAKQQKEEVKSRKKQELNYAKMVKQEYWPKVSVKKQLEIE